MCLCAEKMVIDCETISPELCAAADGREIALDSTSAYGGQLRCR